MSPNQIRAIRAWFDLTQEELAERLGVAQNSVARWENGSRNPSRPVVKLLEQMWEQIEGELKGAKAA